MPGQPLRQDLINLFDYEGAARKALAAPAWDYLAGGATDEITLRRNRAAFEALWLRPRYLRDVGAPDLATTVLGTDISLPVFISPAGRQTNVHPDGELAAARGAQRAGTLMVVPFTPTAAPHAEIASQVDAPLWLQLYHGDRATSESCVREVEAAGYRAICLTCDVPVASLKERDRRHGYAAHGGAPPPLHGRSFRVTPAELEWLCGCTGLPIVVKGIVTAEDARIALECGARAIFVSNHGGRLLDSTLSSIESLPEVVSAVHGRAEVYVDSGVRRGADVLKALALGARAVGIGRPFQWGLVAGGADGVHAVLEVLRAELSQVLTLAGQSSIHELDLDLVGIPAGWGSASGAGAWPLGPRG